MRTLCSSCLGGLVTTRFRMDIGQAGAVCGIPRLLTLHQTEDTPDCFRQEGFHSVATPSDKPPPLSVARGPVRRIRMLCCRVPNRRILPEAGARSGLRPAVRALARSGSSTEERIWPVWQLRLAPGLRPERRFRPAHRLRPEHRFRPAHRLRPRQRLRPLAGFGRPSCLGSLTGFGLFAVAGSAALR